MLMLRVASNTQTKHRKKKNKRYIFLLCNIVAVYKTKTKLTERKLALIIYFLWVLFLQNTKRNTEKKREKNHVFVAGRIDAESRNSLSFDLKASSARVGIRLDPHVIFLKYKPKYKIQIPL